MATVVGIALIFFGVVCCATAAGIRSGYSGQPAIHTEHQAGYSGQRTEHTGHSVGYGTSYSCPGPEWYSWNSWCYMKVEYYKDFANAEDHCNCKGAHLASVHSEEEMYFIYHTVIGDSYKGNYWIGANDRCYECSKKAECAGWTWTDGTYYDYYDFAYGQPNDRDYSEDCVEVSAEFHHKWADRVCEYKNKYICKAPATAAPVVAPVAPHYSPTHKQEY